MQGGFSKRQEKFIEFYLKATGVLFIVGSVVVYLIHKLKECGLI